MGNTYEFDLIVAGRGKYPSGVLRCSSGEIMCADGTLLSVHVGYYRGSIPNDIVGPYTAVEVFELWAKPPGTWREYFEGNWDTAQEDSDAGASYNYVPVGLVREFIKAHGGEHYEHFFHTHRPSGATQEPYAPKDGWRIPCLDVNWRELMEVRKLLW